MVVGQGHGFHAAAGENVDVTGGMVGKVKELLDLADYGISSEIINANEEGAISKALQGMKVNGTKICRK